MLRVLDKITQFDISLFRHYFVTENRSMLEILLLLAEEAEVEQPELEAYYTVKSGLRTCSPQR